MPVRPRSASSAAAIGLSAALHVGIAALLWWSLRPGPEAPISRAVEVTLLSRRTPPLPPQPAMAKTDATSLARPAAPAGEVPIQAASPALPSAPVGPTQPDAEVRAALRASVGCANPDAVALTAEEREQCRRRLASAKGPVYAVLAANPSARRALDQAAATNDILRDYRSSRRMDVGGYPGLEPLVGMNPLPATPPP